MVPAASLSAETSCARHNVDVPTAVVGLCVCVCVRACLCVCNMAQDKPVCNPSCSAAAAGGVKHNAKHV